MSNCYNPFSLEGKTVLVTGASSGIGQATAIECSKLGAHVVVTGRNEARLSETCSWLVGEGHSSILADLTSDEDLERLIKELPNIDGAVLCAGIGDKKPIKFSSKEKFHKIFDANFFSQAELVRLLVKKKKCNEKASIAIISSIGGNYTHYLGNAMYDASKAALMAFVKSCAFEFAPRIRFNAICPGMVETPLTKADTLTEEQLKEDMNQYPMKRYGHPDEIAKTAIYLLSDASSWITGTDIVIDGGITL